MSTAVNTLTVLTKGHIKFLQTANSVVFRYVNERSTVEIESKMGARLDIEAGFHYHGYGSSGVNRTCTKAFAMIHSPGFTPEWLTVVALLKPGDMLELDWLSDINGYVRVASHDGTKKAYDSDNTPIEAFDGLHLDQMRLTILRGKQRLTFNLCLSVCPNNSARMFKY